MTAAEMNEVKDSTISIYFKMSERAASAGFLLADLKLEFGRDRKSGKVILGDSIGPDEFRMWPASKYVARKDAGQLRQAARPGLADR